VHTELSEQNTLSWLSAYLRDHLDPHLAILTSPVGPFYACTPIKHSDLTVPLGVDSREGESVAAEGPPGRAPPVHPHRRHNGPSHIP
jgi:Domain of unknown function (DUF4913)